MWKSFTFVDGSSIFVMGMILFAERVDSLFGEFPLLILKFINLIYEAMVSTIEIDNLLNEFDLSVS